jgi:hypothetical protein
LPKNNNRGGYPENVLIVYLYMKFIHLFICFDDYIIENLFTFLFAWLGHTPTYLYHYKYCVTCYLHHYVVYCLSRFREPRYDIWLIFHVPPFRELWDSIWWCFSSRVLDKYLQVNSPYLDQVIKSFFKYLLFLVGGLYYWIIFYYKMDLNDKLREYEWMLAIEAEE